MKVLLVGGDSDLAQAIASKLVSDGSEVIRTSRKRDAAFLLDLSEPSHVAEQMDKITVNHLDVSHCIITAAVSDYSIPHRGKRRDTQLVFNVNYFSPVIIINTLIPIFLRNKRGHIQVISSSSAFEPEPMSSQYSASKSAISNYAKSIAQSYGKQNIVSYSLCPSFFNSKFLGKLNETRMEQINQRYPSGKMLSINEVANVSISFLQSGEAVNGTCVNLKGGMK